MYIRNEFAAPRMKKGSTPWTAQPGCRKGRLKTQPHPDMDTSTGRSKRKGGMLSTISHGLFNIRTTCSDPKIVPEPEISKAAANTKSAGLGGHHGIMEHDDIAAPTSSGRENTNTASREVNGAGKETILVRPHIATGRWCFRSSRCRVYTLSPHYTIEWTGHCGRPLWQAETEKESNVEH
ncbi:hypothetical protein FB451DRAFT_1166823 [Mycena latifolia]|nr:hypothetical protein FB451DRAFT_1166823 [Mycena latifolia]